MMTRSREKQEQLRNFEKEEKGTGKEVKVGYHKLTVNSKE